MRYALPSVVLSFIASGFAQGQVLCPPPPITPAGPNVSPSNAFSVPEYAFVHSGTNLQGYPAYEKHAAGMFWNPPGAFGTGVARAFGAFSSAIVVNNTSNVTPTNILIDYFDTAGTLIGTTGPFFIAPEGSYYEDARPLGRLSSSSPGLGSARVRVVNPAHDAPIVGGTLHYFDSVYVPAWGVAIDPDWIIIPSTQHHEPAPGEGSYQQLQAQCDSDAWLYSGPHRVTNVGPSDFENGSSPIFMVKNPNGVGVTATAIVFASSPAGLLGTISTRTITIPANGMFFDTSLWTGVNQLTRNATGNYDFDLVLLVIPQTDHRLIGETLVIDTFKDGLPRNMNFGGVMRMTSAMHATNPKGVLVATDISTFTPPGGANRMITTETHVCNVGFAPTSPVLIEYFNHAGLPVGTDTIPAGLAPGATLHIGAGQAQTPNFPANPPPAGLGNLWNGWLRVSAGCADKLIGWTHREVGKAPNSWPQRYQYYKAYGEEMTGANGAEPGDGFTLNPDPFGGINQPFTRKVMPLVRTWAFSTPPYWPGYTTFAVDGIFPNIGQYYYRFFELSGIDRTNYNSQPIVGATNGACSFTYEESDPFPFNQLSLLQGAGTNGNGSGRVDHDATQFSGLDGINVLGDPFEEFRIGQFARRNLGPRIFKPVDPTGIALDGVPD